MNDIPLGPPDALFGLVDAFNKDPHPKKVGLAIGAYRDGKSS
jgi:aspartate/tyrosine/aromatic aminotransferase